MRRKVTFLISVLVYWIFYCQGSNRGLYFIPGHGCGGPDNPVLYMETLPDDLEELKELKCVQIRDFERVQRWRQTKIGNAQITLSLL